MVRGYLNHHKVVFTPCETWPFANVSSKSAIFCHDDH